MCSRSVTTGPRSSRRSSSAPPARSSASCPRGDDESDGHPQPDLIGALGRHAGAGVDRPLVFSTELARSTVGDDVRFGMVKVRSNGTWLLGAQLYDRDRGADPWNSFELP